MYTRVSQWCRALTQTALVFKIHSSRDPRSIDQYMTGLYWTKLVSSTLEGVCYVAEKALQHIFPIHFLETLHQRLKLAIGPDSFQIRV